MKEIQISLVGEKVNAIQFVMDYLQIHFNSKGFTFYIWPSVIQSNEVTTFGDNFYRDKLCSFINKTVADLRIAENDYLKIAFEDKSSLLLNLNPNNPEIISEIAIFHDENGELYVFE